MEQKSPFTTPCPPDLSPIPTHIVAKTIEVANAVLSLDCKIVFFFLSQNQFTVA